MDLKNKLLKRLAKANSSESGMRLNSLEVRMIWMSLPTMLDLKPLPVEKALSQNIPPLNVHIRWMIRRDMAEVLEIERGSIGDPWSEEDFIRCLRQRNCIGMVAEYDERVVGFMIYELHKNQLHVLNFSVRPAERRRSVGHQMVQKLVGKLPPRRNRIEVQVEETNLDGLLFLKCQGFKATGTDDGAITMQRKYRAKKQSR